MVGVLEQTKLKRLAEKINSSHNAVKSYYTITLEKARDAGKALLEVKELLPHGEWGRWCKRNCAGISERTIQNYMRIAGNWEELQGKTATVADIGVKQALQLLAEPQRSEALEDILDAEVVEVVQTDDGNGKYKQTNLLDIEPEPKPEPAPEPKPEKIYHSFNLKDKIWDSGGQKGVIAAINRNQIKVDWAYPKLGSSWVSFHEIVLYQGQDFEVPEPEPEPEPQPELEPKSEPEPPPPPPPPFLHSFQVDDLVWRAVESKRGTIKAIDGPNKPLVQVEWIPSLKTEWVHFSHIQHYVNQDKPEQSVSKPEPKAEPEPESKPGSYWEYVAKIQDLEAKLAEFVKLGEKSDKRIADLSDRIQRADLCLTKAVNVEPTNKAMRNLRSELRLAQGYLRGETSVDA